MTLLGFSKWATTRQNVSSGVSNQARHKQACTATETSLSLEISAIESRDIILSKQRTTKALIRLRGCASWSVPLLFAYDIRHVFSWPGSSFFSCLGSTRPLKIVSFILKGVDEVSGAKEKAWPSTSRTCFDTWPEHLTNTWLQVRTSNLAFEPAHKIMVLFVLCKLNSSNVHAQPSNGARSLIFGQTLHLLP